MTSSKTALALTATTAVAVCFGALLALVILDRSLRGLAQLDEEFDFEF